MIDPALSASQEQNISTGSHQSTSSHQAAWIIILLLIFFPPLAWYFMWREPRYHTWFPVLLLIYSAISLTILSIVFFFVYPQINKLYESLDVVKPNSWSQYAIYALFALAVLQILFSFVLFRQLKIHHILKKNYLVATIFFLALYYLSTPIFSVFAQLSAITPIYTLTNSVNDYSVSPTHSTSPTPASAIDPTTDWKTYQHTDYNFSLNYPSNLTVQEEKFSEYNVIRFTSEYKPPFSDYVSIGLLIYSNIETDLKTWIDTYVIQNLPSGERNSIVVGKINSYENGTISGYSFIGGKESLDKYIVNKIFPRANAHGIILVQA